LNNRIVNKSTIESLVGLVVIGKIGVVPRTVLGKQETSFKKGIAAMLFAPKEKGQGLVEYAIILALVAIVVIAVMQLLGPKIGNTFSTINSSLP
jgi:pilus assembly protein Flp/PilA